MQLVGNRSLDGCPAHFRAPSADCARCRRHGTGPSTTFSPGPSTIPRISRKPQAVYLRFCFYDRRRGRWVPPKRSRWAASVARGPRGAPRGPDRASWPPRSRVRPASSPPAAESFSEIVLASPSEFPYSTSSHGGVAQLGERLTGSQEVRGSIPLVSTRALNEAPTQVGAFFHIGTQGQRRHHDPPGRQDRTLNGCLVHGSISRRGATLLCMEVLHCLCNH